MFSDLHGAIGEHRRSSRSSSVSSGGSSTNSAEGIDSARQHSQSRLSVLAPSQLHSQDLAVEQSLASGNMQASEKKDAAEMLTARDGKLVSVLYFNLLSSRCHRNLNGQNFHITSVPHIWEQ